MERIDHIGRSALVRYTVLLYAVRVWGARTVHGGIFRCTIEETRTWRSSKRRQGVAEFRGKEGELGSAWLQKDKRTPTNITWNRIQSSKRRWIIPITSQFLRFFSFLGRCRLLFRVWEYIYALIRENHSSSSATSTARRLYFATSILRPTGRWRRRRRTTRPWRPSSSRILGNFEAGRRTSEGYQR